MARNYTEKQFKYQNYRLTTGLNKRQCAEKAGYTPGVAASASATRNEKTMAGNELMQEALTREAITYQTIAKKIKKLMNCKHPFAPKQPDNQVQLKAVQEGGKILDSYPTQKLDINKTETKFIVSIEAKMMAEELMGEQKFITVEPEKEKEIVVEPI